MNFTLKEFFNHLGSCSMNIKSDDIIVRDMSEVFIKNKDGIKKASFGVTYPLGHGGCVGSLKKIFVQLSANTGNNHVIYLGINLDESFEFDKQYKLSDYINFKK